METKSEFAAAYVAPGSLAERLLRRAEEAEVVLKYRVTFTANHGEGRESEVASAVVEVEARMKPRSERSRATRRRDWRKGAWTGGPTREPPGFVRATIS